MMMMMMMMGPYCTVFQGSGGCEWVRFSDLVPTAYVRLGIASESLIEAVDRESSDRVSFW